jgi:hypothetical protein
MVLVDAASPIEEALHEVESMGRSGLRDDYLATAVLGQGMCLDDV